ncbi:exodeoxyribonuclease VII large subunit [Butyricimonas synergistica]|uniref:exodeoxyribonuclease VII large subunit n=1 Tax=Butyricimonas synergistica TaxID=544644 RepID=UPI000373E79F|nr:exodeoxyribonuclease VII large subunit [Butyricimonas synergistica]
MDPIGLYQLNTLVKQELKNRFPDTFLVVAEIADVKENRSGHCYLELVEKREEDDAVIAMARATIWAFTYRMLKPYFETTTGKSLQRGIKVLVSVEIVFHELYGYSLNIKNIDPTFTVGDLERKRKEIIDRLTREGVIDMNRELELPLLPKTIAVISSPTAAGYGDFVDQLHRNVYGYAFHTKLFPAVMQGEKTTESVIAALERIYEYEALFDVVVIIRGGGSQTDLGSFDSYDLAANVAQFPIPVLAGIGHERDETIVDRVAYRSVKTPTAAAAFLIERFNEAEGRLEVAKESLMREAKRILQDEKTRQVVKITELKQFTRLFLESQENRLMLASQRADHASQLFIGNRMNYLEQLKAKVEGKVTEILTANRYFLELAETKMKYADPKNILEKGFSITRVNGKAVRDSVLVREGDVLETELFKGIIRSEVKDTSK